MHKPLLPRIQPLAVVATLLFAFTGSATAAVNHRPSIIGTPPPVAVVGKLYSFRPTASDPDGQKLAFAIARMPSWAKFDKRTGRLYGKPTAANIGIYKNITIAVSDGKASTYLRPFRIEVQGAAAPSTGSVTLRWVAPTRNADGSALTNLAGYNVRYGTNKSALAKLVQVNLPQTTEAKISGLAQGTWYFAVTAYTNTGVESEPSAMASKAIP